jgi:(p)ppGpp synthase/HD superfamily hydrolase
MVLTKRFEDALLYAAQAHAAQQRKASQVPYVAHLLSVAGIVLEYGGTEDEAIAAVLHDVVEDQGGRPRLEALRAQFGTTVADIVESCSEPFDGPELEWRDKKLAYLEKLRAAPPSVVLVAAADKLHNATSLLRDHRRMGAKVWRTFKQGTLWFYRRLLKALEAAGHHQALVSELRDAIRLLGRI